MTKPVSLPEMYKFLKRKQGVCTCPNLYNLLMIGTTLLMTLSFSKVFQCS